MKSRGFSQIVGIVFIGLIIIIGLIISLYLRRPAKLQSRASEESVDASAFKKALLLTNPSIDSTPADFATVSSGLNQLALKEPYTVEAWVYPMTTVDGIVFGTYYSYSTILELQRNDPYHYGSIPNYRLLLRNTYLDKKLKSIAPMFEIETATNGVYDNFVHTQGVLKTGEKNNKHFLSNNSWNHVAATAKSEGNLCTITVFVNGRLADTASKTTTGKDCFTNNENSNAFNLGVADFHPADPYNNPGGTDYFNGKLDEVRLTKAIKYTGKYSVPTLPFSPGANTVALWHLNSTESEVGKINLSLYGNASFAASKHR